MFNRRSILPSNFNHPRRGDLPVFIILVIAFLVIWLLVGYIPDDCTDCYAYGDCFYYSGGTCYGTIGCIDGGAPYSAPPVCNYRSTVRSIFDFLGRSMPEPPASENGSLAPTPDGELNPAN